MCVSLCVCLYVCVYTCICVGVFVSVFVCVYAYACVCVCTQGTSMPLSTKGCQRTHCAGGFWCLPPTTSFHRVHAGPQTWQQVPLPLNHLISPESTVLRAVFMCIIFLNFKMDAYFSHGGFVLRKIDP